MKSTDLWLIISSLKMPLSDAGDSMMSSLLTRTVLMSIKRERTCSDYKIRNILNWKKPKVN